MTQLKPSTGGVPPHSHTEIADDSHDKTSIVIVQFFCYAIPSPLRCNTADHRYQAPGFAGEYLLRSTVLKR